MRTSVALFVLLTTAPFQAASAQRPDHTGAVTALAFSPKGDFLLSTGEDGRVLVWDTEIRKVVHRCPKQTEKLYAVAWRPDSAQFAVAGESGIVRVWEVGGNKPVAEHKGHIGPVTALAYSPDGKVLASGGYLRTIRFWTGQNDRFNKIQDVDGRVTSLAFTDDGKALVVGTAELTELRINGEPYNRYGEGGLVRVYDAESLDHKLIRKLDVRGSQVAVAGDRVLAVGLVASEKDVQKDGRRELHTSGTSVVSIADLKTGKALATARGAGLLAVWSKDGTVLVCGGECYRHYAGNIMLGSGEGKPGGIAISKALDKDDKITTGVVDPRERLSNNISGNAGEPPLTLRDPKTLKKGEEIYEGKIESLALSPDGKLFAVGDQLGIVRMYKTLK